MRDMFWCILCRYSSQVGSAAAVGRRDCRCPSPLSPPPLDNSGQRIFADHDSITSTKQQRDQSLLFQTVHIYLGGKKNDLRGKKMQQKMFFFSCGQFSRMSATPSFVVPIVCLFSSFFFLFSSCMWLSCSFFRTVLLPL